MNGFTSLFAPDSKLMYYLGIVYDLLILNLLFILCCLPVFTAGASATGLYTGLREIMDRDSGNTPKKSFFKGFKNGFLKITVIWSIGAVVIALLSYCVYYIYALSSWGSNSTVLIPTFLSIIGIAVTMFVTAQASLFHSKFDCSLKQLFGNSLIMMFSYPGRSILIGLLAFGPLIVFLINEFIFLFGLPVWVSLYFSFVFLLNATLMKKPFEKIIYPNGKPEEDEDKQENKE